MTTETERTDTIDVVVVAYNNEDSIEPCIESARVSLGRQLGTVYAIDNASTDNTVSTLKVIKEKLGDQLVTKRLKENKGFAAGVNQGMVLSKAAYTLLLNPDAVLERGNRWDMLIKELEKRPSVAAVGLEVRRSNGATQASAYKFPRLHRIFFEIAGLNEWVKGVWGERTLPARPTPADYVQGSAMLIRRLAWKHVGAFDEENFFLYHEEMDWCYRARQRGYQIYYWPYLSAVHHGGWRVPPGRELLYYHGLIRFFEKHHSGQQLTDLKRWMIRGIRLHLWRISKQEEREIILRRKALQELLTELENERT